MPLVAFIGPGDRRPLEPIINAVLAAGAVGLCWRLAGRLGVQRLVDRSWLAVLFGFSTQIRWVTTRGGVWHTGHLIATILTFAACSSCGAGRRAWLIGLLAGAAFLTRAPLAFAIPFYALLLDPPPRSPGRDARRLRPARRRARSLARAGRCSRSASCRRWSSSSDTTRSGSGHRSSPATGWRRCRRSSSQLRDQGLFSLSHLGMNIDYFLFHLPKAISDFAVVPSGRPRAVDLPDEPRAALRGPRRLAAGRAPGWLLARRVAVLIPTLLYYGGGWLQYGYRYFLDSVPFVIALCASRPRPAGRSASAGGS